MKSYKNYRNNSVIESYIKTEKVSPKIAENHFNALKDFLKLTVKSKKPCFPSKEIDNIWHVFIMFTRDYQDFCISFLGDFVHHTPYVTDKDKISYFKPGYFCYLESNNFKSKFVRSLSSLEKNIVDCGSGGDCGAGCGSSN